MSEDHLQTKAVASVVVPSQKTSSEGVMILMDLLESLFDDLEYPGASACAKKLETTRTPQARLQRINTLMACQIRTCGHSSRPSSSLCTPQLSLSAWPKTDQEELPPSLHLWAHDTEPDST